MREPGAILLVSCYELGHQPLAVAWAAAFLEARGYAPAVMDVSVEPFDPEQGGARPARRRVGADAHRAPGGRRGDRARPRREPRVPRRGVRALRPAERRVPPRPRRRLRDRRRGGGAAGGAGRDARDRDAASPRRGSGRPRAPRRRTSRGCSFPVPSRAALPSLKQYARLERDGRHELVGYVEASRGCKHLCRHCPIPPVYGGRFFVVPPDVVLADVRQCVEAGATHVTFGDPDFLNGPRHALAVARALHAAFPHVSFDFTAKVEHLLRHRAMLPELRALGCAFVVSAVESLSDTVLAPPRQGPHARRRRRAGPADARGRASRSGPPGSPSRPGRRSTTTGRCSTSWTREDLVDAVDPVQYSLRLLVPPGSLLVDHPAMRPHLGPLVERAFSYALDPSGPADGRAPGRGRPARGGGGRGARGRGRHVRPGAGGRRRRGRAPRPGACRPRRARPDRARPPRLTEPWFC